MAESSNTDIKSEKEEQEEKRDFTCVVCPIGCHITATLDSNLNPISIVGNSCPRGKRFVISELTDPRRTLSSTIRIISETYSLLPVRTSEPIPKTQLLKAMEIINSLKVSSPIKKGDIIIKDFIIPNCNLIACKTIE